MEDWSMIKVLPRNARNLYEWFDLMRERPAKYIGSATLDGLAAFISGHQIALETHGIDEHLEPDFVGFGDFISKLHGTSREAGWHYGLLSAHHGNQEEALKFFFERLDEFRSGADVFLDQRIAQALIFEVTARQDFWRKKDAGFDAMLRKLAPILERMATANCYYGLPIILLDVDTVAAQEPLLGRIISAAKARAKRQRRT